MQLEREPSSRGMTWALTLIGAFLIASIMEEASGVILGGLLGFLLAQVLHLRGWVRELHRQLRLLELRSAKSTEDAAQQRAAHDPVTPAAVQPQQRAAAPPRTAAPPTTTATSVEPLAAAADARPAQQTHASPRPRTIVKPAQPAPIDRLIDQAIAWLKGGNPLARLGIVILFFGAAFLAKYAADNSLFPIELRFIAIALGAFALLIVGWRLRDKRAVYAQLLQGGGIAGLYLTVFAAMKLYQLLPATLAFALMLAIVLAAAVLAVAQNALPLAVIGTAGGFLAPIFVSTGGGSHVALFSYYTLLNLGVFAIAWFRTWRVLNVLGFFFTFSITALWRASGYESGDLVSADAFLILFFLMYVAVSILNCIRQPPNLKGYVSGSLVFGLPIVAFGLHASIIARIEYGLAWSALALGAFYLLLGWALWRSRRDTFRLLVEAFAALGVIFASLAIPLAFDAQMTAAMWAVEGAGLLWLGLRQRRKLARAFGTLLQLGAAIGFFIGMPELQPERFAFNSAYLGTVMLAMSALASSFWLHRDRERLAAYEQNSDFGFALWGVAWWICGGLYQIAEFLEPAVLGGSLIYVSISALALAAIGHRRQWLPAVTIAWVLPALSGIVALAYLATLTHPFAELGAAGWTALLGTQYLLLYASDRLEQYDLPSRTVLHAGACWLLTLLAAAEISWQLALHVSGVWSALPWGLVPALALALLSRRKPRPEWPLARHLDVYRFLAALPLAAAACVWIVGVNLLNRGDTIWLPYIPLLNPLDVSVALCLLSLAVWWIALDDSQRQKVAFQDPRLAYALIAGLTFLWLNAALIRALHYVWDAPLTLYGIARSTLVQAALSIFWGVLGFAAMSLAARSRLRVMWIIGAALMSIVVLKLFLIDLSNSGTVARIASFLSVGALLLVTGYMAPLPPKRLDAEVKSAA